MAKRKTQPTTPPLNQSILEQKVSSDEAVSLVGIILRWRMAPGLARSPAPSATL